MVKFRYNIPSLDIPSFDVPVSFDGNMSVLNMI
jgi:hypothetical protein